MISQLIWLPIFIVGYLVRWASRSMEAGDALGEQEHGSRQRAWRTGAW
jgi:hypothetical protein